MIRLVRALSVFVSALALLLLSSAGVEIAEAGDPAIPHLESGPSCSVDEATQNAGTAARLAEIQARLALSEPEDDVIPLNGSGYNYPSGGDVSGQLLRLDAELQGR